MGSSGMSVLDGKLNVAEMWSSLETLRRPHRECREPEQAGDLHDEEREALIPSQPCPRRHGTTDWPMRASRYSVARPSSACPVTPRTVATSTMLAKRGRFSREFRCAR